MALFASFEGVGVAAFIVVLTVGTAVGAIWGARIGGSSGLKVGSLYGGVSACGLALAFTGRLGFWFFAALVGGIHAGVWVRRREAFPVVLILTLVAAGGLAMSRWAVSLGANTSGLHASNSFVLLEGIAAAAVGAGLVLLFVWPAGRDKPGAAESAPVSQGAMRPRH